MLALLWKEYRQNRLMVVVFAAGVAALQIVARFRYEQDPYEFGMILFAGSLYFVLCAFGGNAVAAERERGTLKFLFESPISRFRILLAKTLFSGAGFIIIAALNSLLFLILYNENIQAYENISAADVAFIYIVAILMAYFVSLFFSIILKNGLIAAVLGCIVSIAYVPLLIIAINKDFSGISGTITPAIVFLFTVPYFLTVCTILFCIPRRFEFTKFKSALAALIIVIFGLAGQCTALFEGFFHEEFTKQFYSRNSSCSHMFDISPDRQKIIFFETDFG